MSNVRKLNPWPIIIHLYWSVNMILFGVFMNVRNSIIHVAEFDENWFHFKG